jgi:hypothetical protein
MANPSEEFEPYAHVSRTLKFWWVLVLFAVVGGMAGFGVHRLQAPVYEATAVILASIDFNKIDFMNLPVTTPAPYRFSQNDEDISLYVVNSTLVLEEPRVLAYAQSIGIPLDDASLKKNSTIERRDADWELRFRSTDPLAAQKIVNYWVQIGYSDLQAKLKAGEFPEYLFFDLIHLADVPTSPTYYQTNSFVLAGGVIGWVAALLLVNLPGLKNRKGV